MVNRKRYPDGIGPVIKIALFGIGRAGKLYFQHALQLCYQDKSSNNNKQYYLYIKYFVVYRRNSFEQYAW